MKIRETTRILAFVLALGLVIPATLAPFSFAAKKKSKLTDDNSEAAADRRHLLLTTGEDKIIDIDFDVPSADLIKIGNPQLVATTLVKISDKRQIVFKPLKAGETTVTVRDGDGNLRVIFWVRVTGSNLLRVASEVRDLLRDVEGLNIRIVGPKVIIEGEVLVPADYGRLLTVISDKAYSDFVMNLATLSPLGMQVLAKRIRSDINVFAPNVTTRVVNGKIFLEGTVDSADQATRAVRVANTYLPPLVPGNELEKDPSVQRLQGAANNLIQNFIVINPPPPRKQVKMVRITLYFVQLGKDYTKKFGFQWEPTFTSNPSISVGQQQNGAAGAGALSLTGTLSSLLPSLDSLTTAGYARVVRSGTVIVRSGQPAKLVEATDYAYEMPGGLGMPPTPATTQVGFTLAVTPLILGQSDDIQMDIHMQQSSIVGAAPVPGSPPPTTSTHNVNTTIYVKSKESAAIAGVTASDIETDFNKHLPNGGTSQASGATPLFNLLRSKKYDKQKNQFVVFVTPQIIDSASEGTQDLKKTFRVNLQ